MSERLNVQRADFSPETDEIPSSRVVSTRKRLRNLGEKKKGATQDVSEHKEHSGKANEHFRNVRKILGGLLGE